ncbi:MAG: (d)CMP kinase [Bacteroidetes bacterium]|nr:(d)CMP kinase [Bacteroidota bacterium]
MNSKINISIDGHAGCGKGTLAKHLAKSLNYSYFDTGAIYRALALLMMNNKLGFTENFNYLNKIKIEFKYNETNDFFELYINDELAEYLIKTDAVSKKASEISKTNEVNNFVTNLLQKIASEKGNVVFGRDTGTKVLPNAELKIYMITNPEVRAKRVFEELKNKNINISYDEVLRNIKENDIWDLTNAVSPIVKADDSIILDNTNMTKEEQGKLALTWAKGVISAL